jgi:DNA-binding MarR family transcriptional regulator
VNAVEVYLLGRKMMKVAERAMPSGDGALSSSVRSVLVDIAENPDSSISDITARTSFPQSHVSAAVAQLRESGTVETRTDPADARRTLASVTELARDSSRASTPVLIDAELEHELGDSGDLQVTLDALAALSEQLTPKLHKRFERARPRMTS